MEILDTRTDPPTISYGICYPCEMDSLVEAIMRGFVDAAKENGFEHLMDTEATSDKIRQFVANELQDRRCRTHYVEPATQSDSTSSNRRDYVSSEDDSRGEV